MLSDDELARLRSLLDAPAEASGRPVPRFGRDHHLSRIPDPDGPQPGTWQFEAGEAQRRRAVALAAERQAEEDRLRRQAEDAEAERAAGWAANQENRERALVELERLAPEIQQRETEADAASATVRELYQRRSALREEAERFAPKEK